MVEIKDKGEGKQRTKRKEKDLSFYIEQKGEGWEEKRVDGCRWVGVCVCVVETEGWLKKRKR